MKALSRRLFSTAVLISLVGSTVWAADVSFEKTVASPGATVLVSVDYRAKGDQVAAIQFDVLFDPTEVAITAVNPGPASTDAGKTVASNLIAPGQMRVLIFGLNQSVIGDGIVATLTAVVGPDVQQGQSRLEFDQALGASPEATEVAIKASSGHIQIKSR
jgi:cohesin domain-containing protein